MSSRKCSVPSIHATTATSSARIDWGKSFAGCNAVSSTIDGWLSTLTKTAEALRSGNWNSSVDLLLQGMQGIAWVALSRTRARNELFFDKGKKKSKNVQESSIGEPQQTPASPAASAPLPAFATLTLADPFCGTCQTNVRFRTLQQLDGSEVYCCETCDSEVGRKAVVPAVCREPGEDEEDCPVVLGPTLMPSRFNQQKEPYAC